MDAWAYRSHMRAVQAIDEGRLQEEIFPIEVTLRDGTTKKFDVDEHPRRETSMEKLGSLKQLHPEIEGFGVTAGNASGINDAGAAMVLVDSEYAEAHGLKPLAKILSWASIGCEPRDTGSGPIFAIPKALQRAGMTVADVDLVEINEAFASVPVATCRQLGLSEEITNVNGSGCSFGSPGCRDRRPHDHDDDVRARPARRRHRRREHVRGRRHGFRDRLRGLPRDWNATGTVAFQREGAELAEGDGQRREVEDAVGADVVEEREHAVDARPFALGPDVVGVRGFEPGIGRAEDQAGDAAVLAVDVLEERAAGERLPAVVAREVDGAIAEPVEREPVADDAEQRGDVVDGSALRRREIRDVERGVQRIERRDPLRELERDAEPREPARSRRRTSPARSRTGTRAARR